MEPSVTGPPAAQPVATFPSAPTPVATEPVATEPVATEPVATPRLNAQSAPLSPGHRSRRLYHPQPLVTQGLGAKQGQAARLVTTPKRPLSPPPHHPSLGLAAGPLEPASGSTHALAAYADLATGSASAAAPQPRPGQPAHAKPAHGAGTLAGTPPPIMPALPVQTPLPRGAGPAASGEAVGSVAPPVAAAFEGFALALALILLARVSLERATWRSALVVSRLEHPD